MDEWQQGSVRMSDITNPNATYGTDEWEDWLRWDPTTELLSPDTSSKQSADSPASNAVNGLDSAWLSSAGDLSTPLVIDEETSMLDPSSLDFTGHDFTVNPFVFTAQTTPIPVVDQLRVDSVSSTKHGPSLWPTLDGTFPTSTSLSTLPPPSSLFTLDVKDSTSGDQTQQLSPAPSHQHQSSPTSLSPVPVTQAKKKAGKKRKSDKGLKDGSSGGEGEPPVKKTSHNVIEKRYRNNLNDKILELRNSVPSLRAMAKSSTSDEDDEDLEGLIPAHKSNKTTIMAKATEYIKHLEKRNKIMADEMDAMKSRLADLEKAYARVGAISEQQSHTVSDSSMVNRGRAPLNMQQPQPQTLDATFGNTVGQEDALRHVRSPGGSTFLGKLMVTSMAALMVMEGLSENDQSDTLLSQKGLFAAPLHLAKRSLPGQSFTGTPYNSMLQALLPLLKLWLVLGAIVYLVSPLFKSRSTEKTSVIPQITLTTAPSLASPVEIRRKAWLTAIQSVWTPKPFLLEVVAVCARMAELTFRRVVGFDKYAELLGMSKDEEAARIKAWDIAIDAQLAGGDAEVSCYHLLLTLMASGTLPDSPIRLMQKAVHFRIFFWEVANAGYGNLFMFKDFTAKVARIYWDSARAQQKALLNGQGRKVDELDQDIETLPDHLAALIELECDEVLTNDIIQRAYNLAWNRPSAENTPQNATLDRVVEDPAIRSPLDAIAAWFTNTVVDEALVLSLHVDTDVVSDLEYLIKLAATTSPPASSTQTRAYVARAVLLDENRETSIALALESMPIEALTQPILGQRPTTGHLDVVNHVPLTPEVRTALTLAKLLSISNVEIPSRSQARAAMILSSVQLRPTAFTLLTAVAAHKVLDDYAAKPPLFAKSKDGLERLAFNLRLWVGTRGGKSTGLQRFEKGRIVDKCLSVTKKIGGWRDAGEVDSGYGSDLSRCASSEAIIS